jgi:UMF1 family MFS transporter
MPASSLILVGILTPLAGILGALGFARLQRKLGWTNLKTLVTLVCVASAVPIYGCIGILPWFHGKGKWKFGGLTTPSEMFVLAVYFGESAYLTMFA